MAGADTDEQKLMAMLQGEPALFYIVRDANHMRIVKLLESGGRSVEEVAKELGFEPATAGKAMDGMVERGVLGALFRGGTRVYFLNFKGKRLLELYRKTKEAL
jgi:predicted transcriptional regulator